MNAFERHKIRHLSASSLNTFASEPALWVMERLLGKRGSVGCAAHRGTAAEAGIVAGLLDHAKPVAECQAIGLAEFDKLAALSGDSKRAKEREAVPGIVATALPELRQYGIPQTQVKIERNLPGVPVPWLGFIDLYYPDSGIVVDIKSQLRLSSDISSSHARQVSLYTYGTNNEGRIAYCTPAKIGVYRIENAAQSIADMTNIAKRLEAFLSLSDNPAVLAGVLVPRVDDFWYSDPMTRALARETFGL